ncbi:hypothetical protein N431DRAFT_465390 [Stipitochalara longipes BDJ]|nr:hypothetical protein N431DRAFT_465390 [Stipitochalara longipes BDJ]
MDSDGSSIITRTKPTKPMTSLLKQAENAVLKQLTKAIDGHQAKTRYCCGGSIPVAVYASAKSDPSISSTPVVLRWDDPTEKDVSRRLRLPIAKGALKSFVSTLENLRILDVVAQTLLPGTEADFLKDRIEHRGVTAVLDHLRILSAPASTNNIHLPTPKDFPYLGKLLVSLPTAHHGGHWQISNAGHSTLFGWDCSKSSGIHWAAYISERVGTALHNHVFADPARFPLYEGVKQMLEHPGFMKEGGVLGFYCQYPYSHTKSGTSFSILYTLQGVDMVIETVFRSIGLKTYLRPVLDLSPLDDVDQLEYDMKEDLYNDNPFTIIQTALDIGIWDRESIPDFPS